MPVYSGCKRFSILKNLSCFCSYICFGGLGVLWDRVSVQLWLAWNSLTEICLPLPPEYQDCCPVQPLLRTVHSGTAFQRVKYAAPLKYKCSKLLWVKDNHLTYIYSKETRCGNSVFLHTGLTQIPDKPWLRPGTWRVETAVKPWDQEERAR